MSVFSSTLMMSLKKSWVWSDGTRHIQTYLPSWMLILLHDSDVWKRFPLSLGVSHPPCENLNHAFPSSQWCGSCLVQQMISVEEWDWWSQLQQAENLTGHQHFYVFQSLLSTMGSCQLRNAGDGPLEVRDDIPDGIKTLKWNPEKHLSRHPSYCCGAGLRGVVGSPGGLCSNHGRVCLQSWQFHISWILLAGGKFCSACISELRADRAALKVATQSPCCTINYRVVIS